MEVHQAIRMWLTGFAGCVQRRDFKRATTYFHRRVYGFGSYANACHGIDALVARQWKQIWPNITGFRFELRHLHSQVSADGRWACAMVPWRSTGYRSGRPFRRWGRMTVLLTRAHRRQPWRALHTHYSLDPGTPQTTVRKSS